MTALSITTSAITTTTGSRVESGICGAAITIGQAVYLDSTTGTIKVAHCETSAVTAAAVGIAVNTTAAAGQPIDYVSEGPLNFGAILTVGKPYVLGATGAIHPVEDLAAADYVTILGGATTTSQMKIRITALGVAVPGS